MAGAGGSEAGADTGDFPCDATIAIVNDGVTEREENTYAVHVCGLMVLVNAAIARVPRVCSEVRGYRKGRAWEVWPVSGQVNNEYIARNRN